MAIANDPNWYILGGNTSSEFYVSNMYAGLTSGLEVLSDSTDTICQDISTLEIGVYYVFFFQYTVVDAGDALPFNMTSFFNGIQIMNRPVLLTTTAQYYAILLHITKTPNTFCVGVETFADPNMNYTPSVTLLDNFTVNSPHHYKDVAIHMAMATKIVIKTDIFWETGWDLTLYCPLIKIYFLSQLISTQFDC